MGIEEIALKPASISLEEDVHRGLSEAAAFMGKPLDETVHFIREWLETNAYLPVHMLDEDDEVEGNA